MSAYISATFEKTLLPATSQVRVILRNRDDGGVPPSPSVSYFPTNPDDLKYNVVVKFVSRTLGEEFQRIALLADLTDVALPIRALDTLEDLSTNFLPGPLPVNDVTQGDLLTITLSDVEPWNSNVYSGNPFQFTVQSVTSTRITVTPPFPAFANTLSWAIPARGLSGIAGVTIRNGNPANTLKYRDSRFQRYYTTALEAETSVTAMKADLTSLATATVGATLTTEVVTLSSSI